MSFLRNIGCGCGNNDEILFFILIFLLLFSDTFSCGCNNRSRDNDCGNDSSILFFIILFLLLFSDNGRCGSDNCGCN